MNPPRLPGPAKGSGRSDGGRKKKQEEKKDLYSQLGKIAKKRSQRKRKPEQED